MSKSDDTKFDDAEEVKKAVDAFERFSNGDQEEDIPPEKRHSAINLEDFKKRAQDDTIRLGKLESLPHFVKQKATLISAHFLLPSGAKVADMGCGDGSIVYALALLNPRVEFLGIDKDPNVIEYARRNYELPNLVFSCEDVHIDNFRDNSLDGIINSNIFHEVYSDHAYNINSVSELLEVQIKKLKLGGVMLVRDYMNPPPNEFVLLELPTSEKKGKTFVDMSDADLLVNFSETARPAYTAGCEGFFLEEIEDTIREDTRLFRLPRKWAVEFIHRKDERENWEKELYQEYTFFTYENYKRDFLRMGMRLLYTSPYWNPWVVDNRFRGQFQLYTEEGSPLPPPATNYFIIAQRLGEKGCLALEERRPVKEKAQHLEVVTVRDKKSGKLHELVREPEDFCDIIPYRITVDGRLVVYIHTGVQRPIVNAVNRGNMNLDGKFWSGHLIEPITMDIAHFEQDASVNKIEILRYLERHVGLSPRPHGEIDVGLPYFPDPSIIDEAVEPVYIEVRRPQKTKWAFRPSKDASCPQFSETGYIYELEANDILNAAQIGVLPDPRLEIRVFELMMRLGLPMPKWMGEKIPTVGKTRTSINVENGEALLDAVEPASFVEEKGEADELKVITSLFVEEGHSDGGKQGLTSQKVDFMVTEDGIENIAVVLPLTHGWDDGLLVALDPKMMSVPQRMGGSGSMLTAPSFKLPKGVSTISEAKKFIADKFGLESHDVKSLGESYFTHTSITPQRVYPFMVMANASASIPPHWRYTTMKRLWILIYCFQCFSGDLLKAVARTHMALGEEHSMSPERKASLGKTRDFKLSLEKEELYQAGLNSEHRIPSRILGEGKFQNKLVLKNNTIEEKAVSIDKDTMGSIRNISPKVAHNILTPKPPKINIPMSGKKPYNE